MAVAKAIFTTPFSCWQKWQAKILRAETRGRNPGTDETRGQTERLLLSCAVARLARVVAVDVPHHVTQRGNARQCILDSDADRMVSLDLLRRYAQLHELFLGWLLPDVESRPSGGDPSCYRRQPRLAAASARILFEQALQRMRRKYSFYVCGYVVMPQHVHILLSEPERKTLAAALQSIKQKTFRLSPVFISTHQDSVRMRRTDSFV